MERNFGKYDVPPTLQILIDLEEALGEREHFYYGFNFYLSMTNFRYFNTPSDVIVFGNIGADGIHYGFLTDYGSAVELEETPIVCVCPMDFEQPTRIIAKNLRDFLCINSTDSALFYNYFANEESYLATRKQWDDEAVHSSYRSSEQELSVRKYIANSLKENIEMPIIDNPYRYI